MNKKKKSQLILEKTDQENSDIDLSKKDIEKLPDISPGHEQIVIMTFDEPEHIVPESDNIFLAHEMNDITNVDPVKFYNATNRNKLTVDHNMLEELSKDNDSNIRAAIARNCFVSGEILHKLAQEEEDEYIRECVASNDYGHLEEKTMELLSKDKDEYVRMTLSNNKQLSTSMINKMLVKEKSSIFVVCNLIDRINKSW